MFITDNFNDLSTFNGVKSGEGYCILKNGLIIQWGYTNIVSNDNDNTYTTFPLKFPNGCLRIVGTHGSSSGSYGCIYCVSVDQSSARWFANVSSGYLGYINWIAIGY